MVWLLCTGSVWAEPHACTQRGQTVEAAAAQAREWVARPVREVQVKGFSPAADIRHRVYDTPRPLRMWIIRIDLTAPGVRVAVTEPADLACEDAHCETLCANTLQFARQRGAQLAINASAFAPFRPHMGMPMDVVGLAAANGRVYSQPDERFGAMYVSHGGRIALKGPPLDTHDVWHVVAGFRMLVDDGRIVVSQSAANSEFGGPNPRTAVGVDKEGRTLWIVVVDGRQTGVSEGMTLVELASLYQSLRGWDALNLDGGGSSTFVLEGADGLHRVINTPVGWKKPGSLRQVANNLGFYLPGATGVAEGDRPVTMRDAVIRLASSRRGGGYKWKGDGVSKDVIYDGQTILCANPEGTFCCGATLEMFLDAYCTTRFGGDCSNASGRWFEDWPTERIIALKQGWWGMEEAVTNALLPEGARATIREKQVYHVLPWTGLGEPVENYRLLQRGDFVQFWRKSGSGHSAVFWGRDRDESGRERLWYWSSQPKPRHAYPFAPGGKPVKTPGHGINWEYVGDEIDPARIYGVRLVNPALSSSSSGAMHLLPVFGRACSSHSSISAAHLPRALHAERRINNDTDLSPSPP